MSTRTLLLGSSGVDTIDVSPLTVVIWTGAFTILMLPYVLVAVVLARPPLVFSMSDVDWFCTEFEAALTV